jgi:hypothetical protein
MVKIGYAVRSLVAGAVAIITCPCHLPITLPLVISLTAGTAFSAWLAAPRDALLVGVMATIVFSGGMVLAFKWMGEARTADSQTRLSKAISPSTACASCQETPEVPTEQTLRPSIRADLP